MIKVTITTFRHVKLLLHIYYREPRHFLILNKVRDRKKNEEPSKNDF